MGHGWYNVVWPIGHRWYNIIQPMGHGVVRVLYGPWVMGKITEGALGFANSPAEFQASMTFILQMEIPETAGVFMDDIPIEDPETNYVGQNGEEKMIPENSGIKRFIWEHLQDLHQILHRIGEAGGTVSGKKTQLCRADVKIMGQKCSSNGREPTGAKVRKTTDWPRPENVIQVREFLGLCGTVRI